MGWVWSGCTLPATNYQESQPARCRAPGHCYWPSWPSQPLCRAAPPSRPGPRYTGSNGGGGEGGPSAEGAAKTPEGTAPLFDPSSLHSCRASFAFLATALLMTPRATSSSSVVGRRGARQGRRSGLFLAPASAVAGRLRSSVAGSCWQARPTRRLHCSRLVTRLPARHPPPLSTVAGWNGWQILELASSNPSYITNKFREAQANGLNMMRFFVAGDDGPVLTPSSPGALAGCGGEGERG